MIEHEDRTNAPDTLEIQEEPLLWGHAGTQEQSSALQRVVLVRLGWRCSRQRVLLVVGRAIVRIAEVWYRVHIGGEQAPRLGAFPAQVEAG